MGPPLLQAALAHGELHSLEGAEGLEGDAEARTQLEKRKEKGCVPLTTSRSPGTALMGLLGVLSPPRPTSCKHMHRPSQTGPLATHSQPYTPFRGLLQPHPEGSVHSCAQARPSPQETNHRLLGALAQG